MRTKLKIFLSFKMSWRVEQLLLILYMYCCFLSCCQMGIRASNVSVIAAPATPANTTTSNMDNNAQVRPLLQDSTALKPWPTLPAASSSSASVILQGKSGSLGLNQASLNESTLLSNLCRVQGRYLLPELFDLDTCALCYFYIPDQPAFFKPGNKLNVTIKPLWINQTAFYVNFLGNGSLAEAANASAEDGLIRASFSSEFGSSKWASCCEKASECCQTMLSKEPFPGNEVCPRTWDGWQCFPDALPTQVVYASCPHYIYFGTDPPSCTRQASKLCMSDGRWFRKNGLEKSNYTTCSPVGLMQQRTHVHVAAYGVSIAALLPALFIFMAYKQLNVHRIRLHKNMFLSILLNSIMVITFKSVIILPELGAVNIKDSYIKQNGYWCKLLFMLTKYFRMTNYMWMFCEGYYLHRLISAAFAEQKSLVIFYVIGWVFPLIPTVTYSLIRELTANDNCWVVPIEIYEWILNTPCLISLVVNMVFLVNIIRILVIKLRTAHNPNEPSQYRKAVRATLVLVPLFGLHFIVTIYRPPTAGCEWIEVYYYLNYLLDGLQGFLVAIIFCYANGEVHYLLKRTYDRIKDQYFPRHNFNPRGSIFLGRSTASTHFTLVDSPNPQKRARILSNLPQIQEVVKPTVESHTSQGNIQESTFDNRLTRL